MPHLPASPRRLARIAGVLYLIIIVLGIFGQALVMETLVVAGDVAATAANLEARESLWRLGFATHFFYLLCAVPLLLILFILFRPVSLEVALLVVFFNLISLAMEGVITLFLVLALFPLGEATYLGAFAPEQLHVLMRLLIRANGVGFSVTQIFFAGVCVSLGYLIYRSTFVPRVLGVLMALAGLAYWINGFLVLLAPGVAAAIGYAIMLPAFIGETSFTVWLLARGVNEERWFAVARGREPLSAAPASA